MILRSLPAKIIFCIFAMEILGGLGAALTINAIPSWYSSLFQPPGTPPNWVFGPVWSTLYAMIGLSFALVWHQQPQSIGRSPLTYLFALQLFLNLLWTPVFFGFHQLTLALVVIASLLIAIALTTREFHRISPLAGRLLIPYFIWVCYATYLNAGYAYLN